MTLGYLTEYQFDQVIKCHVVLAVLATANKKLGLTRSLVKEPNKEGILIRLLGYA